jgi:ornithine decarboxylase
MERYPSAAALIAAKQPLRPVLGLRPHAAGRAARWFRHHFPGDVAYAYKANSSVFLVGALYGAGIRHFDVASVPEIEDAATIPGAKLHYMHPVKARDSIRRAYHEFGVRSFSLDSEQELEKILEETGHAGDLALWLRLAVEPKHSRLPLQHKFGIAPDAAPPLLLRLRQVARAVGVTFHVGSQTETPDAYVDALDDVGRLIVASGVVLDGLDVGGGFPASYGDNGPAPLIDFMTAIRDRVERLPITDRCRLMCEPGRALVAEAESLILRVDARRGKELYVNDGAYGMLFDAAHLNFGFPVRMVSKAGARSDPLEGFRLWGPTCDSIDRMEGPFMLPASIGEGDYIEVGNIGAYARAIAGRFNGYGAYDEAILKDEPMFTMYPTEQTEMAGASASQPAGGG